MATSTVSEYVCPPRKRRLDKASGESKSSATRPDIRPFNPNDDECIRQYILYYCQFHKSEGFVIDWDTLEYEFETVPIIEPDRPCHSPTQPREEIAAVQVDPPPPLNDNDPEVPTILFAVTYPGSGSIPNVFFTRIPAQVSSRQHPHRESQNV